MTTDAIFDMASVSKCVGTTLSFMRVVEDGLVRLTDNVSRYIPGFKPWESTPEKKGESVQRQSITITNLLNHTSGLPSYVGVPGFLARFEQYGDPLKMNLRDSLTAYLTNDLERLNRPGEVMRYSCLNFITLQTIIERTTGMRLDHFAKQEVFDKLRLKNTWYNCIADAERPFSADAKIVPTEIQPDGKVLYGEVHDPLARVVNGGVSGNAGVFSTAEDLAVIASLMLNDGVIRLPADGVKGFFGGTDRIRLYSKNTVDAFTRIPAGYEEHGRALGWDIGVSHGSYMGELLTPGSLVNHSGYTGTSMAINQKDGIAIIFLTNRVHPYDDGGVARARATVSNIVVSAMDHK
jgi:CubicO group peptidase (beta-lactamase class C family)